jgi:hypothetical protein
MERLYGVEFRQQPKNIFFLLMLICNLTLEELKDLVQYVPDHDVVIGYRAKRRDPLMRLLNAKGWNILNRMLFGLRVRDIDCAFKLFKRDLVKDLPVKARGAMLSAEFLIRLQRRGIIFKEIPVTHLPRLKGSPTGAKPAVIIRAFKEMLQIYNNELGDAFDTPCSQNLFSLAQLIPQLTGCGIWP